MDLLKDLTRELRDRDGDARDAGTVEGTADGAPDDRDSPTGADADPDGPARDDEHVCRFCQTAFEARRGACPECGAQLILRGER